MKHSLIFFLLICLFCPLFAQWEKIDFVDFETDRYEVFASPSAVYKFKKGTIDANQDGNIKTIYVRIHILSEEAIDELSTVRVFYSRKKNIVRNIKGRTLNYENGEIEITDLQKDGIFREQVDKTLSKLTLTLPKVKKGSIIEYQYEYFSDNYFATQWFFQQIFPVLHSRVVFRAGARLQYQPVLQGTEINSIRKEFDNGMAIFSQKNIPALKKESYVPNLDDYRSKVLFQLVGYIVNGQVQKIFNDWNELTSDILYSPQVGKLKKPSKKLYKDVAAQVDLSGTEFQQMDKIFKYVRKKVKWNGTYNFIAIKNRTVQEIHDSRMGNSGEVNMVLISLLKSSGIEVQPMLISTIYHGNAIKVHPFVNQFDQLAALVRIGTKKYVLDASQECIDYKLPPENLLGQEGWVLDMEIPRWHLVQAPAQSQIVSMTNLKFAEDDQLRGEVSTLLAGYPEQEVYTSFKEESEKDFWSGFIPEGYEYTEEKIDGMQDDSPGIYVKCEMQSPDWAILTGDLILVDLMHPWKLEENPFQDLERTMPIDMSYPMTERRLINLQIPEGYTIESYPKPAAVSLPGREIMFVLKPQVMNEGKLLMVEWMLKIDKVLYSPKDTELLKRIFDEMIVKEGEPVVLKKISE